MLDKVKKTIIDNNMISDCDKVLVALSGGCDSVCLCLALKELGINFSVAHLNHMIRNEADSDEQFCKSFADKIGVRFYSEKVNIPKISKQSGVSEEVAGRNARYDFLERLCKKYGFTKIAVAHNINDNAETVLLNLLRGSGLKGLCGIPKTRGNIIRPLIDIPRNEIERFVEEKGQRYVTDKTNFSNDYTRNKIRNNVIEKLLEINPSALSNISKTSDILTADETYFKKQAEKHVYFENGNAYIKSDEFEEQDYPVQVRMLGTAYTYVAGTGKDFEKKHIDYIIENCKKYSGNIIELCFDIVCRVEYGNIVFEKKSDSTVYSYILPPDGEIYVEEAGVRFVSKIIPVEDIKEYKDAEFFTLDVLNSAITVRSRKAGDRIIPFGKKSYVKVKDVLIKEKIPQSQRKNLPVIEADEVLWLYGVKRSNFYKIENDTKKVLMIKGEKTDA